MWLLILILPFSPTVGCHLENFQSKDHFNSGCECFSACRVGLTPPPHPCHVHTARAGWPLRWKVPWLGTSSAFLWSSRPERLPANIIIFSPSRQGAPPPLLLSLSESLSLSLFSSDCLSDCLSRSQTTNTHQCLSTTETFLLSSVLHLCSLRTTLASGLG